MSDLLQALYAGERDKVDELLAADPTLDVFEAAAFGRAERLRELLEEDPSRANAFGDDGFHIAELEDQDIRRMAELVETYIDLPLGIVDAAVIAIAERLRLTEIATLDHRHFTVVRPRHTTAFVLLPGSDA